MVTPGVRGRKDGGKRAVPNLATVECNGPPSKRRRLVRYSRASDVSLDVLNDDILLAMIGYLRDDHKTLHGRALGSPLSSLKNFSLTSRRMHLLARHAIFERFSVTAKIRELVRHLESFQLSEEAASLVKSVRLPFLRNEGRSGNLRRELPASFINVFENLPNLRKVSLRFPPALCGRYSRGGDGVEGRAAYEKIEIVLRRTKATFPTVDELLISPWSPSIFKAFPNVERLCIGQDDDDDQFTIPSKLVKLKTLVFCPTWDEYHRVRNFFGIEPSHNPLLISTCKSLAPSVENLAFLGGWGSDYRNLWEALTHLKHVKSLHIDLTTSRTLAKENPIETQYERDYFNILQKQFPTLWQDLQNQWEEFKTACAAGETNEPANLRPGDPVPECLASSLQEALRREKIIPVRAMPSLERYSHPYYDPVPGPGLSILDAKIIRVHSTDAPVLEPTIKSEWQLTWPPSFLQSCYEFAYQEALRV